MTLSRPTRHLIIGGAAKAGTTSVFNYLRGHPEVCTNRVKELNYFTAPHLDLQVPKNVSFWDKNPPDLDDYFGLFPCAERRPVLCEASVHYFESLATPKVLADHLTQVKMVFLVRDPVERLYSHYLQFRKTHMIVGEMTFREFYEWQLRAVDHTEANVARRALLVGCYSRWLAHYYDVFPASDILVLSFDALKHTPQKTMQTICRFAGIDEGYYDEFTFKVFHRTKVYRSKRIDRAHQKLMKPFKTLVENRFPRLSEVLHAINHRTFYGLYEAINLQHKPQNGIPPDIRAELEAFYADEAKQLAEITRQCGLLT